jgi:murein L,D-transpeptidase YafK
MKKSRLFLIMLTLVIMLVVWKLQIIKPVLWRLFANSETAQTLSEPFIKLRHKAVPRVLLNEDKVLTELMEKNVDKNNVKLYISKSAYKLTLVYDAKKIKEYPIVLGADPINDKLREGDRRTPEGKFKIKSLYPHQAWSKFIWIDYPTADSWEKHNRAKVAGKINASDNIGGQIGIHGVPEGSDQLVNNNINWTLGCISLKIKDINEIFSVVQTGTPIEISH